MESLHGFTIVLLLLLLHRHKWILFIISVICFKVLCRDTSHLVNDYVCECFHYLLFLFSLLCFKLFCVMSIHASICVPSTSLSVIFLSLAIIYNTMLTFQIKMMHEI